MKSNKTQIQTILKTIKKSQQSIQVKTSIYLKKIQELIFSNPPIKLTNSQIQLLLRGIEDDGVEGLTQLCGNKGTLGGLKKSSFYALEIFYRLLTETKNKEDYLKIFGQFDYQQYKSLRLATHISQNKSQIAFKICGIIRQQHFHLDIGQYIFSEQSQKKFLNWLKTHDVKKKGQEIKNIKYEAVVQVNQVQDIPKIAAKQTKTVDMTNIANLNVDSSVIQFQQLNNKSEDYLERTFVNPITLIQQALKSEFKQIRKCYINQRIVQYLLMIPVCRHKKEEITNIVKKIHIQSTEFDAKFFLKTFYEKENKNALLEYAKLLNNIREIEYPKIIYYGYNLSKVIQMQVFLKDVINFYGKKESIKQKQSIGYILRTKIKGPITKLQESGNPILEKFTQSQKTRKLIIFFQNNHEFMRLPLKIKQLLTNKDYKSICSLFKKHIKFIYNYKNHLIIKNLVENILQQIRKTRSILLNIIINNLQNWQIVQQNLINLVGLHQENILDDYIVEKINDELIKQIKKFIKGNNTQVSTSKTILPKQILYFGQIQNLKQNIITDDSDLIQQHLNSRIRGTFRGQQSSFEQYYIIFQQIFEKLKNFIVLLDKIANCEFDKYISKKIKSAQERKQIKVKYIKNFDSGMIKTYQFLYQQLQKCKGDSYQNALKLAEVLKNIRLLGLHNDIEEKYFRYLVNLKNSVLKSQLKYEPSQNMNDLNKNIYNNNLIKNCQIIFNQLQEIIKIPIYDKKYIITDIIPLICYVVVPTQNFSSKSALLTFISTCKTISEGSIIIPFIYKIQELLNYDHQYQNILISQAQKSLKLAGQKYANIIGKQYQEILRRYKFSQYSIEILDMICQNLYEVAEYCNNMYDTFKGLFLQVFISEFIKQKIEQPNLKYFSEFELIRSMTNRISSKNTDNQFSKISQSIPWSQEDKKNKDNYILKTRHKLSVRYQSILKY